MYNVHIPCDNTVDVQCQCTKCAAYVYILCVISIYVYAHKVRKSYNTSFPLLLCHAYGNVEICFWIKYRFWLQLRGALLFYSLHKRENLLHISVYVQSIINTVLKILLESCHKCLPNILNWCLSCILNIHHIGLFIYVYSSAIVPSE